MTFRDNFCPSPWIHTRITNQGNYQYCRWAPTDDAFDLDPSIKCETPIQWFQKGMSEVRRKMLAGEHIPECKSCYIMEKHGRVSGRQKQLLKIGITLADFEKTMLSSPWLPTFIESLKINRNKNKFI